MKRIIILAVILSMSPFLIAQTSTDTTVVPHEKILQKVDLGIEAGISLLNNSHSPYSASPSYVFRLPLTAHLKLAERWNLNVGLRYDFQWDILRHNVTPAEGGGIELLTTPTTGRQTATAFHSYLGIPLELEWLLTPNSRSGLRLSADIYAAYAVSEYLTIRTLDARNTYYGMQRGTYKEVVESDDPMFQPWKLEIGLKVSTDAIGLLHGIRFFTNLLPTYIDPATNQKIYTSGITLFL
ncbi:MAG: hypothetical protein J6Y98_09780 [Bacteroidales bacterium]|nr:hypothetical protein [Bacteroidales bacterium]